MPPWRRRRRPRTSTTAATRSTTRCPGVSLAQGRCGVSPRCRGSRRAADPAADPAVLEHLRAARFLIEDVDAEARRTHLLYVSLETCTSCNHRCPFCPVSVDPRDREVMSQELFESIVDQVVEAGGEERRRLPVELQRADRRSALRGARAGPSSTRGLPVSILTNASHLDPERAARLEREGRFRYVGINLPTLDPERYLEDARHARPRAGARQRRRRCAPDARRGDGDRRPRRRGRGAPPRRRGDPGAVRADGLGGPAVQDPEPAVERHVLPEPPPKKSLRGCELMGSRPFEHLHVTATAKAVLCCQDYYENADRRRPEDADGGGDPRRRHHGAAARAGPTASKRRPTTSSAAAASSRSASERVRR